MKVQIGLLLVMLVAAAGCDPYDVITIVNRSDAPISVEADTDTVPQFPSVNKTEFFFAHLMRPNDSSREITMGKHGWSFMIDESVNKKFNLFVYDIDSLRKYQSIDTLIRKRLYRRLEFSKESVPRR